MHVHNSDIATHIGFVAGGRRSIAKEAEALLLFEPRIHHRMCNTRSIDPTNAYSSGVYLDGNSI